MTSVDGFQRAEKLRTPVLLVPTRFEGPSRHGNALSPRESGARGGENPERGWRSGHERRRSYRGQGVRCHRRYNATRHLHTSLFQFAANSYARRRSCRSANSTSSTAASGPYPSRVASACLYPPKQSVSSWRLIYYSATCYVKINRLLLIKKRQDCLCAGARKGHRPKLAAWSARTVCRRKT